MATQSSSTPLAARSGTFAVRLRALAEALRPRQWVKNGFVSAPLIFARELTHPHAVLQVAIAAADFCALASAAYLINDVFDVDEDRHHPAKRLRPLASGRLSAGSALGIAVALDSVALAVAWRVDPSLFLVAAIYVGLSLLYSGWLKRVMLVDVFLIAAGFLLRVVAGGVVIHVEISSWLIVCTTLLALFLALCKRRHELVLLGGNASAQRSSLAHYSPYFLDQLIVIVTSATVISYALYTLSPDVSARFPGKRLELTVPFVLFGIFRYLFLVHRQEEGGDPARTLFSDAALLVDVLLWVLSVVVIIYL
jgi:4-hydroxybenzoate polyprenyltransferase